MTPETPGSKIGTISNQEFKRLGLEWTALDNDYDSRFQAFVDNPGVKTSQEMKELETMQKRLFDIETQLLKVAKGEVSIEAN